MKINSVSSAQYLNNADKAKQSHDKALQNIAASRALSGIDSANLAIADSLLSQANVLNQGISNANDAIGVLGIADSTLSNLTQTADRLNELSVKQNNPTLSQRERNMLSHEAEQLKDSMKDSLNNATFNGKNVFNGQLDFNTGANIESFNLNQNSINGGIDSLDIRHQDSIQNFNDTINSIRSDIGSAQQGILAGINSSLKQNVALRASESGLQNNDIAENLNEQNNNRLKLDASIMAQAHNVANLKAQMDRLLS